MATTKKKQFYVFSEASVNRGSLFISADVEKFIIRFSSLGFLSFARSVSINDQVLLIEHKVTNVWSISTYVSSFYDFWTVAICPCSTKKKKKNFSFEIVKSFDFRVRMFVSSFSLISRAKRAGRKARHRFNWWNLKRKEETTKEKVANIKSSRLIGAKGNSEFIFRVPRLFLDEASRSFQQLLRSLIQSMPSRTRVPANYG